MEMVFSRCYVAKGKSDTKRKTPATCVPFTCAETSAHDVIEILSPPRNGCLKLYRYLDFSSPDPGAPPRLQSREKNKNRDKLASHTLSPLRRAQMKCMGGFDDFRKQKLFFLPRRSPLLQVRNSLSSRQDKKRHGISSNLYIFALFSHPDDSSQCRPAGSTGVSKACLRIEKGGGGRQNNETQQGHVWIDGNSHRYR